MEQSTPHRKRNKKYNIPGHAHFLTFSCYRRMAFLTNDTWRQWLAESVRAKCDEYEYALWAYVFMPEHVHLLLKPRREMYDLAKFEQSFKLSFSRKLIVHLSRMNSPLLQSLRVKNGYRVWQEGGGHDLNIWTMKKAIEKAEYCHGNPVKRRLVKSAEEWRWSSFCWLVQGKREGVPLRVDGWDETLREG
ncbi:MAG TPA: transposase [Planctomycetota bacterium]|nr:transposase [Planctomycetota bacterium]